MKWFIIVLKKYATFSGRARRKEFWIFYLINILISAVLAFLGVKIDFPSLSTIYSLAIFLPSIAVTARRMHDTGKSGWYYLIPLYNLYLLCIDGDKGGNSYGPDPKNRESLNEDALDAHLTS